jgi:hypothetical protein
LLPRQPLGADHQHVRGQHDQGEVGRQQVTQELGELSAEVRQVRDGPDDHEQRLTLLLLTPKQAPTGHDQSRETRDAERWAHRPLHDVLQHERVRSRARPLNHEGHVDPSGADLDLICLIGKPLRVQSQAPHGRAEEGVGFGEPEDEQTAHQRNPEGG